MFRLTMMGASDVRLQDDSNFIITIMGGASILLPTVAEKIRRLKKGQGEWGARTGGVVQRTTIVTLMGGTVLEKPTLAREIEEMAQLRQSGLVSDAELQQLWREVIEQEDRHVIDTYTLMGVTGDDEPSLKDEIKALRQIAARGIISAEECEQLSELLRGKPAPHVRYHLLQQRIHALLSPPTEARGYSTNPFETGRLEDRETGQVERPLPPLQRERT
jgi:hypothetical protein